MSRVCYTYGAELETNEKGIRILEYDMCIWVRISGSIKKRSKSETRKENPSFLDEI